MECGEGRGTTRTKRELCKAAVVTDFRHRVVISSVAAALLSMEFGFAPSTSDWNANWAMLANSERLPNCRIPDQSVNMEYFCPIPDTRNVTQCYSVKTGRVSTIVHHGNATSRGSIGADSIRRLAHICSERHYPVD